MELGFRLLRWASLPFKIASLILFTDWWKKLPQRFGLIHALPPRRDQKPRLWVHVPSIGEVNAVDGLLSELIRESNFVIAITTEHFSSYSKLVAEYSNQIDLIVLAPFDLPKFIDRTWRVIEPDLIVSVHQTAWFELWRHAVMRNVPVILINASLSNLEFRLLRIFQPLARFFVASFERIYARNVRDKERFLQLGVPSDRVTVVGNLKGDMKLSPRLNERKREALLREVGFLKDRDKCVAKRPIVLIGISTWPGEEKVLLRIMNSLRKEGIDVRLILAPRFPERRMGLKLAIRMSHYNVVFHSRLTRLTKNSGSGLQIASLDSPKDHRSGNTDIFFLDVTGELMKFLQIGDIGFVGNSLPPHSKGQNPFECAICELPFVVGPNTEDFSGEYKSLVETGGCLKGEDRHSTMMEIERLIKDSDLRHKVGLNALKWFNDNSADSSRIVEYIDAHLSKSNK
jgi:3-deoxy-D-manno-octulosonic-acid transferase